MKVLLSSFLVLFTIHINAQQDTTALEKKLWEFAWDVEFYTLVQDKSSLEDMIDQDGFESKLELTPIPAFNEGIMEGLNEEGAILFRPILTVTSEGGWIEALNVTEKSNDRSENLFRIIGLDRTLNYFTLEVNSSDTSNLGVVDAYFWVTDINMSGTINETIQVQLLNMRSSSVEELKRDVERIQKCRELQAFDPKAALRQLEELESSFKDLSFIITTKNALRAAVYPEAYRDSLDRIIDSTDVLTNSQLINFFTYYGDLGEVETSLMLLDQLDERVGIDPYLNVQRSAVYLEARDFNSALNSLDKLAGTGYELEFESIMLRAVAHIESHEYDLAVESLQVFYDEYWLEEADFRELFIDYPRFINSSEVKRWMENTFTEKKKGIDKK